MASSADTLVKLPPPRSGEMPLPWPTSLPDASEQYPGVLSKESG